MIQYYLNNDKENSSCCSKNEGLENHLNKTNYLSEFTTPEDKELVRDNLGISEIVNLLKTRIDRKVINAGDVVWDDKPTEGNIDKVLSSDVIYKALQNCFTQESFESAWEQLTNTIEEYCNNHTEAYNSFQEAFVTLQEYVNNEYNSLYNSLYSNLYNDKISVLEAKVKAVETLVNSFLRSKAAGGGIALSSSFGEEEYIGINQKALTEAINKIWDKLSEISGDDYKGINLQITPDYFFGDQTNVHIIASSESIQGKFEKLQIYLDENLITEAENVDSFEYDITVNKTSVLKCIATILGIEYKDMKTIYHYNAFWMGSGSTYQNIITPQNVVNLEEKKNYDVIFNNGDYLIIVTEGGFIRADMNGLEIPFNEPQNVIIDGKIYKVYKSKNTYNQGTYNIDINS